MNSFSLLPCRTSRPWHFEPSDHHRHGGAHRLPEIAHQCASSVRVEVAGNHAAAKSNGPAQLSRFKTTQQHNANRKTYFLNSIGPLRQILQRKRMLAFRGVIADVADRCFKRREWTRTGRWLSTRQPEPSVL